MLFQFAPIIQAGIAAGQYAQVFTAAGVPIGMVRDKVTGQFVAHAVGAVVNHSPLAPLATPFELLMGAAQMYQTHRGFQATYGRLDLIQAGLQSLQASVGVLQATTAVIGVGVAVGVVLSAVNLHQTLKLREDVKQLKWEVKDGFINLQEALRDQGVEIIKQINQVAQDVEFGHHRTILVQAYGRFLETTQLIKIAMSCEDPSIRNADLANARQMLNEALADYKNPSLLSETCSAGKLRRLECAWAIDQAIVTTYQVQNEFATVSSCLVHLQNKIRQDSLAVINSCQTEEERNFLFPEIARIHGHDLAVLNSWQNHVNWIKSLPPSDLQLLQTADFSNSENLESEAIMAEPPEQLLYEDLKQKSHPASLQDQMRFMMKPDLRREAEFYISKQATSVGHKTLVPSNLQQASGLAVANLYWYFKNKAIKLGEV